MDPGTLSLAALSGVVLTEGVKFLYAQAGAVLDRLRDRGGDKTEDSAVVLSAPPDVLEGELADLGLDDEALGRHEDDLLELHGRLTRYVQGYRPVSPDDSELIETAEALRERLEVVLRQRITLRGEQRPPSGTPFTGREEGDNVRGTANVTLGPGAIYIGRDNPGKARTEVVTGRKADDDS